MTGIFQVFPQIDQVVTLLIFSLLIIKLLSELVFVDAAVSEKIWTLEHRHFPWCDRMEMRHFILRRVSALKVVVHHLLLILLLAILWLAVDNTFHRIRVRVDLIEVRGIILLWLELKDSNEWDLFIQFKSVKIFVVELDNTRFCGSLLFTVEAWSATLESLVDPIIQIWDRNA